MVKNISQPKISYRTKLTKKLLSHRDGICAGVFYLGCIIYFFHPLFAHFSSSIIGHGGDGVLFVWNFWWAKKSVLEGFSPFWTNYQFFPFGVSLVFHTLTLANALVSFPLQMLFNPIASLNIIVLCSLFLSAMGGFVLGKYLTKNFWAALTSGFVFTFNLYIFSQLLGHFNLTTTWPIVWSVYFLIRLLRDKRWLFAVTLGLCLAFLTLNDFQYTAFTALILILLFCFECISDRSLLKNRRLWVLLLVTLDVWALLSAVILLPALGELQSNRIIVPTERMVVYYPLDLGSFFAPYSGHPLYVFFASKSAVLKSLGQFEVNTGVFLGFIPLCLAFFSVPFLRNKNRQTILFWIFCLLLFTLLAWGSKAMFFGRNLNIPLPFTVLRKLPLMSLSRVSSRLAVMVVLSLSVLSAYGTSWLTQEVKLRKQYFLGLFLLLLLLLETSFLPVKIFPVRASAVYQKLSALPSDKALVELPLSFSSRLGGIGLAQTAQYEYNQTIHGKKMVNGYTSQVPFETFTKLTEQPVISFFLDRSPEKIPKTSAEKTELFKEMKKMGIGYVVLHKKELSDDELNFYRIFFEQENNAKIVGTDDEVIAYQF